MYRETSKLNQISNDKLSRINLLCQNTDRRDIVKKCRCDYSQVYMSTSDACHVLNVLHDSVESSGVTRAGHVWRTTWWNTSIPRAAATHRLRASLTVCIGVASYGALGHVPPPPRLPASYFGDHSLYSL